MENDSVQFLNFEFKASYMQITLYLMCFITTYKKVTYHTKWDLS